MKTVLKSLAMAAVVSLVLSAPMARAQTGEPPPEVAAAQGPAQSLIDINPLDLAFGELSLEYERAINPYLSILVGPQILVFPGVGSASGASESGVGITASLHVFPGGNSLHGFWFGPEVDLDYAQVSIGGVSGAGVAAGAFGIVGYTFFPAPHIPISLGLGAGYGTSGATVTNGTTTATSGANGMELTGRLAIGYAW